MQTSEAGLGTGQRKWRLWVANQWERLKLKSKLEVIPHILKQLFEDSEKINTRSLTKETVISWMGHIINIRAKGKKKDKK